MYGVILVKSKSQVLVPILERKPWILFALLPSASCKARAQLMFSSRYGDWDSTARQGMRKTYGNLRVVVCVLVFSMTEMVTVFNEKMYGKGSWYALCNHRVRPSVSVA